MIYTAIYLERHCVVWFNEAVVPMTDVLEDSTIYQITKF